MGHIGTLGFYIEQTSRYPRLNQERELELISKAQKGDNLALEELIKANLWFVVHLVKRYYLNSGLEDHIQNGSLGLLRAIKTYDPLKYAYKNKKPILLRNYATGYIWNYISRGLPSEYKFKNGFVLRSIDEELNDGRNPLTLKLDLQTDIKTQEDIELTDERRKTLSLLDHLNERERDILTKRYGIGYQKPYTLQEIGTDLGLSRERVRQLEHKALEKLRENVEIAAQ